MLRDGLERFLLSRSTDARQHLIALRMAKLDGSLLAIGQGLQVWPLLERKLQELIRIRGRRLHGCIVLDQVIRCLSIESKTASNAAIVESTLLWASSNNSLACDKLTSAKLKSRVDLSLFFVN